MALSDRIGKSTPFIEYMLDVIDKSLAQLLNYRNRILKNIDRIDYFVSVCNSEFTRKDYMNIFKDLSSSIASRDIQKGVELGIFTISGDKNKTKYKIN